MQRFLEQAAADPHVLAIKQTLYRTSGDSPIVDALIDAAEAGKQVLVLVEIKARFDEQANIRWARKLEQAGCHVVYGLVGLKTHCKLALVVRDEGDRPPPLRPHRHRQLQPQDRPPVRGPGPADRRRGIGDDLSNLFNNLPASPGNATTRACSSRPSRTSRACSSGSSREIDHHRAGRPARIRFKLNSIVDEAIIDALYRASQAGVPVELWAARHLRAAAGRPRPVREHPGRSILGRFLEHSRVFWFENGGEPEVWIGSADLMHRNLDRRVEVLVQIPTRRARRPSSATCSTWASTTAPRRGGSNPTAAGPRTTTTPTASRLRTSRPCRSPSTAAAATAGSTPKHATRPRSSG